MGRGRSGIVRTAGPKTSHVHNVRSKHVFILTSAKPPPPPRRPKVTQEMIGIAKSLPPELLGADHLTSEEGEGGGGGGW